MKTVLVILAFFISAAVMAFYLSSSSLNYMEDVSGIKFPDYEGQESRDIGETFCRAKAKLDTSHLKEFVQKYSFRKIDSSDRTKLITMQNVFAGSEYDTISYSNHLYYLDSCLRERKNRILFILNLSSGDLWGVTEYPDDGGDAPCP